MPGMNPGLGGDLLGTDTV